MKNEYKIMKEYESISIYDVDEVRIVVVSRDKEKRIFRDIHQVIKRLDFYQTGKIVHSVEIESFETVTRLLNLFVTNCRIESK